MSELKGYNEFLAEAKSQTAKTTDKAKELVDLNKDRKGDKVVTPSGTEIRNSLVINEKLHVFEVSGKYNIRVTSNNETTTLVLDRKEFQALKNF